MYTQKAPTYHKYNLLRELVEHPRAKTYTEFAQGSPKKFGTCSKGPPLGYIGAAGVPGSTGETSAGCFHLQVFPLLFDFLPTMWVV